MNSELTQTAGSLINVILHELAVHALEYYRLISAVLTGDDPTATYFKQKIGLGKPLKVKLLLKLVGQEQYETEDSENEHRLLGNGGSDYYKA